MILLEIKGFSGRLKAPCFTSVIEIVWGEVVSIEVGLELRDIHFEVSFLCFLLFLSFALVSKQYFVSLNPEKKSWCYCKVFFNNLFEFKKSFLEVSRYF